MFSWSLKTLLFELNLIISVISMKFQTKKMWKIKKYENFIFNFFCFFRFFFENAFRSKFNRRDNCIINFIKIRFVRKNTHRIFCAWFALESKKKKFRVVVLRLEANERIKSFLQHIQNHEKINREIDAEFVAFFKTLSIAKFDDNRKKVVHIDETSVDVIKKIKKIKKSKILKRLTWSENQSNQKINIIRKSAWSEN